MADDADVDELTWVESRLEGSQSVILEHVQKCLRGLVYERNTDNVKQRPTVFPALSKPRKRILAFLCNRPGTGGVSLERWGHGKKVAHPIGRGRPRTS
jgi:hypothetical protein